MQIEIVSQFLWDDWYSQLICVGGGKCNGGRMSFLDIQQVIEVVKVCQDVRGSDGDSIILGNEWTDIAEWVRVEIKPCINGNNTFVYIYWGRWQGFWIFDVGMIVISIDVKGQFMGIFEAVIE